MTAATTKDDAVGRVPRIGSPDGAIFNSLIFSLLAGNFHAPLPALVTSGAHMPRAVAAFRSVGLDVIPAATDIRVVYPLYGSAVDLLPDAGALAQTTDAIKELIGLAVTVCEGRPRPVSLGLLAGSLTIAERLTVLHKFTPIRLLSRGLD